MDGFSSLDELYKRVTPALKSKVKELKRIGVNYVQEADVWNYLKNNMWSRKSNLTLCEMVNDIITVSNIELEKYVQSIVATQKREVNNGDENLL